jgi:nitroreductase
MTVKGDPEMTVALGLSEQDTHTVLTTASLAPSVHNSQPWCFRLLPDRIELHADLSRALPATDPGGRELRLSCGAALFNLRLALKALGIRPLVTLLPGTEGPGALAIVRRGGRIQLNEEMHGLLMAVRSRRTNRRPFVDAPIPAAHRQIIVRAAELERSWLHVVSDRSERAQLQRFVVRAHRDQLADKDVQAELAAWTGSRAATGLGVPLRSAGPQPESQDEWVLRDFSPGEPVERMPGKDYESDPLVVVLCSFYSGPLAELQAGQAMQRVLLAATTVGLSASFLSQPVEVPGIRDELRRALGGSLVPQTMLRIGFGSPVPATPRRSVDDLLIEPTGTPL